MTTQTHTHASSTSLKTTEEVCIHGFRHPMLEEQLLLEERMQRASIEAFYAATEKADLKGESSSNGYGMVLIKKLLKPVTEAIDAWTEEASQGRAGRRHAALKYVVQLPSEVWAYLTLKHVMDNVTKRETLQRCAIKVASAGEDEVWFRDFEAQHKDLFKLTAERASKSSTRERSKTLMRLMANRAEVEHKAWPEREKLHLGKLLVELLAEHTGLIQIDRFTEAANDTAYYVTATEDTLAWIKNVNAQIETLAPAYWPMVCPPKRWTNPWNGGYWSGLVRRIPVVKTRNRNYLSELRELDMKRIYRALNALQETPWRVNVRVREVLRQLMDRELEVAGLPRQQPIPEPVKFGAIARDEAKIKALRKAIREHNRKVRKVIEKLAEEDRDIDNLPIPVCAEQIELDRWMEENGTELKEWKKRASAVHEANVKRLSKCVQLRKVLELADQFGGYEAIYFPVQMDFRGRTYYIPMFLNPQGPDVAKGLLTFARGKKLGTQEAVDALAHHGGNSFGGGKLNGVKQDVDKRPIAERVQWVKDHEALILATAADPMGTLDFWTAADSPFQFLAFCFEWEGYCREGLDFVSTLPVALDGSCNGLQHYSAALRDPVGGAAVNLIPSDIPEDIYRRVSDVTALKVRLLGSTSDTVVLSERFNELWVEAGLDEKEREAKRKKLLELLALWKDQGIDHVKVANDWLRLGLDRKITKRPVMTLPYGSTQFSCREFIEDAIKEKLAGAENPFGPYTKVAKVKDPKTRKESLKTIETDGIFEASLFLQPLVWESIGEVVKAARVGMDWLKECASLAAAEGLPINWTTPDGFLVQQRYMETKSRRVKTVLDGAIIKLSLSEETDAIDKRRQAQGIAPNWVHSMDGTALRMYVNLALDEGVRHFGSVHDSFMSLAADAATMGRCLREAFVQMYTENDPMAEFRVDIAAMLSDENFAKLPPVPAKGDLDVSLVRESANFFA